MNRSKVRTGALMNHTDDIDINVSVVIPHYKSVMPNTLVNTVYSVRGICRFDDLIAYHSG